jgi:hypothetical protein
MPLPWFGKDFLKVICLAALGVALIADLMNQSRGFHGCDPGYSWVLCGYRLLFSAACI